MKVTLTPEQFADRVERIAVALPAAAERGQRSVFKVIGSRAVGTMRPAGGAPIPNHLTVRTGSLSRAVTGPSPYAIQRVEQDGRYKVKLIKGVRADRNAPGGIPGARLHELGGTTGGATAGARMPARPFLRPAVEGSRADVQRIMGRELDKALTSVIQTGTA